MKSKLVSVLTIDIVGSKKYSIKQQPVVKKCLQKSLSQINMDFNADILLPITLTIGDEYQGVIFPHWKVLKIADRLRSLVRLSKKIQVDLHISIGIAPSVIKKGKESRFHEGPAFYLSRQGMDWLKQNKARRTIIVTESTQVNKNVDLILDYQDMILLNWTDAQWQAIAWRDQGLNLKEIGLKLKVAYQNIGKRLKAANFEIYIRGREFLEIYLMEAPLIG
jgi:SatD family (SatD)